MHPAKVVNITDPRHEGKAITLDILAVLTAGSFGYSFARYLAGGTSFWLVLAALFVWSAVSVLEGFLQKNISRRFLVVFLESIALVAFFYSYAWQVLVATAIAVLLCLMWGYVSVRRELRNTVEMRFFTASGKVIGKIITAALIFMILMYGSLMNNNNGSLFVSQNGFYVFFNWAAGFVNNFYPTIPLTGSFGDFAQSAARIQLQNNPVFQNLTPAEQSAAIAQSANQIMGTFSGAASSSAPVASSTANEPASSAFYGYFSSLAARLQARFGNGFIGAWGLALFLVLRSIGIVAVWAAQFVSLIFYEALLAAGFMKISEQTTTKEVIEY